MVLLILLVNFASLYAQQFPMEDFIGVNIRREDPLKYLKPFGFVRDYRDWAVDEGDFYKNAPYGITLNDIGNGANKYRFNPGIGTYVRYDDYYKEIQDQLGYGKICATMKSCLPLLAGGNGEDFAEFKPVKYQLSNTTTASSLTKDNLFIFTPIALTAPVVPSSEVTKTARSYEWISDWVYQFTLKYGGGSNTSSPLKRFITSDNTRNQNRVKYLELWNEPNKYWKRTNDQKGVSVDPIDDGWLKATKFDGKEFAAMASAVYDAHMNTITVNDGSGGSYSPSMIAAAPNMKFANGGTAGIREYDWKFLIDMKNHFNDTRSSATKKIPIDVINFHHYNSSYWFGLQGLSSSDREGVSPEADCWKIGTLAGVDEYGRLGSGEGSVPIAITNIDPTTNYRTFKQRLIELKKKVKDEFGANTELWMSEFGYDTNERSPYRAPNIFTNGLIVANRQEVQGRFLVRAYLEIAAAQWDRAMLFDLRDLNSKSDGILFDACGVVKDRANDYQPKTSYYYVSTLASALKDTKFKKEIKAGADLTWINSNTYDDSNDPDKSKRIYEQHSYNFTDANCHRIAKFVKGSNPSATNAGDIVFAVWLPTSQNSTKANVAFYFNDLGIDKNALDASEGLPTLVTLVEPLTGDINGKNTSLAVMTDGSGRKYVIIPLITENPLYLCLGKSSTEPIVAAPSFNASGVSCDAIKLNIIQTADTKYSVYYYEKNDRDENGTIPMFNLNDPNLKLFAENIETSDVLVAGLNLPHDNYYVFVVAVDKTFATVSAATRVAASTLSCSNNVVITKASASTNDEIAKIIDTKNFSLCYPIREQQFNDLPQLFNANEGYIYFTNNAGSLQEYNLHLASLWDAQGESDLTIQYCDDCSTYSESATSSIPLTKWKTLVRDRFSLSSNKYKTIEYERWVHFPVNVKTDRIKISKSDDEARIRKLVFRGVPTLNPVYSTLCCGANEPNLVTITGNTTVSSQLSSDPTLTNKAAEYLNNDPNQLLDNIFRVGNNTVNGSEINPISILSAVRVKTGSSTAWFFPESQPSSSFLCQSVGAGQLSGNGVAQTLQTRGDAESEFYAEGNHPFVNRKVVEDAPKVKKNMGIKDGSMWIMERDAYGYYKGKLRGNLPTTKALKDFFKKHDNGDIGTLAEFDNEWLKLKEEEYKEQGKEAKKAANRLEELRVIQDRQFDPQKVIELKDAKKVHAYMKSFENDSIKILSKKLYDLDKDYAGKLAKKVKKLLSINNRLSSDVAYVKFEKEINDMYLTLLGNKTLKLTKEQVVRVIEIAMMCPEEAGRAPFKARALYATLTAEPLPDWSDRCRKKEIIRLAAGTPALNIAVYPNPAHDNIHNGN
jgi:hypothetical protein